MDDLETVCLLFAGIVREFVLAVPSWMSVATVPEGTLDLLSTKIWTVPAFAMEHSGKILVGCASSQTQRVA